MFRSLTLIFQEYSIENLSETQKAMLEDLRDYGLVWQRKVIIYPVIYVSKNFIRAAFGSHHHDVSVPPVWRRL